MFRRLKNLTAVFQKNPDLLSLYKRKIDLVIVGLETIAPSSLENYYLSCV